MKELLLFLLASAFLMPCEAQTLYVPSGTSGIGSSTTSNVGIGTSTPSNIQGWDRVLDVSAPNNSKILATSSSQSYRIGMYAHTSWNGGGGFIGTESNHKLFFITNYTPQMTLDVNGYVGIGTTTPAELLQVYSTGQYPRISVQSTSATGAPGFDLRDASGTPKFTWHYDIGNGFMGFFQGGVGNRMVINNSGYVGIGTTSPSSKLTIDGIDNYTDGITIQNTTGYKHLITAFSDGVNPTTGSALQFKIANNNAGGNVAVMTLKGSGNVGIGTTSPGSKLHISAANRTQALRVYSDGNTTNYLSLGQGSGGAVIDPIGTGMLYLGYDQSTNVILGYGGGNVGIGTGSPDAKLAVAGQVHAQEVKVSVTVPGPDYVFEKDYQLTSLEEIKNYIDQNKHLPEVPSAKEMEKNGIQLGEMNMLLLKKIEELTLHLLNQEKKFTAQEERIKELESVVKEKQVQPHK